MGGPWQGARMSEQPISSGRIRRRVPLRWSGCVAVVAVVVAALGPGAAARGDPATRPTVTGLSTHRDTYWGGTRITVHGDNFVQVRKVLFGRSAGWGVEVLSPSTLTVFEPRHGYGPVHVRVRTAAGRSAATTHDRFTFTRPTMDSPIQGGLTARQERRISARVRAEHHGVAIAPAAHHWTPAMATTALRRARSWLGLPYAWDGGTFTGPSRGLCVHTGSDLDCHIVGFDCSGLTLYAWGPYEHLVHYAATQRGQAGRFHPTLAELVPGDLLFFAEWPGGPIGHVVVYAGKGWTVQAPMSGYLVDRVRLTDLVVGDGTYRGATRPMSTGAQGHGPAVSAMTDVLPTTGGSVRISGRYLGTATTVSIGSTRIYRFTHRSAHKLVVTVPPHRVGPVPVTVANAWGSVTRPLTFVAALN